MEYIIQNVVLPTEVKHQQCKDLFFHGSGYLNRTEKTLLLGRGECADFVTYLNGCSYKKWKKYTFVSNVTLHVEAEGEFSLLLLGYTKKPAMVDRVEYASKNYIFKERQSISIDFEDCDEQIIGFEIHASGVCKFYGAYYTVVCDENDLNEVRLCIATTTCKKEDFIKKNVELLKTELFEQNDELKENIYLHVVDNGRTLSKDDIYGEHIYLHPNNNTGGAGGFARGMIESLNQDFPATHVLLMDDDVLMLPESIARTYHLLRLMKDEYKNSFISGAMLYYEEPNRQHEDIGTITKDCMFCSLKPKVDLGNIGSILDNEDEFLHQKNEYAGWWYCCIPTTMIKKYGLPLPLFIRCDDMEYSLRCKANIITMNGICVWHMGFVTKYNAAFDKYQQCRNLLIDKASSNILENVDVIGFVNKSYRAELLKFNYNAAELIVRGLEDFLKGPQFIAVDDGEKIVQENTKLNDKMQPLADFKNIEFPDVFSCYFDPPRKFIDKWLYRITYNGQRFWPLMFCKKGYPLIAFDHTYQPQKMSMHRHMVAVNPFNRTGIIRTLDKKRYRALQKRFKNAMAYYRKNYARIEREYTNQKEYLTSEKFWKKYLKLK